MNLQDFGDFDEFAGYSSPSVPTAFDMTDSAPGSGNLATVSPQDLLVRESFVSAPGSNALTNLTSPSVYDQSPEFNDTFDVSPHFGSSDFDVDTAASSAADQWYPLFPSDVTQTVNPSVSPAAAAATMERNPSASSLPQRKSGNDASPPQRGHGRHSSISGVNSRRRDKPLPPIVIDDPSDQTAMKRARNTLAARKSRDRKARRFEDLESEISNLKDQVEYWKSKAGEKE